MRVINGDPVPSDSTSTAVSPQEQALMDMLMDPLRNPNMSGRVENTFGPIDYIAGAFPIGRVLAPYAARVMNALGLGEDAGVNFAKQAFSNRFGRQAKRTDPVFLDDMADPRSPFVDLPTTQEVLGMTKAPPPQRTRMPMSPEVKAQYPKVKRELSEMDQVKRLVDDPDGAFRDAYTYMEYGHPDFDGGYFVDEAADEITRMAGLELGLLDDVGNPTKAFDDILTSEQIAGKALYNLRNSDKVFNDPTQAAFEAGRIARAQGASPEAQKMAIDRALKMAKRRFDFERQMAKNPKPKPPQYPDLNNKKYLDEMDDLLRQMLGDE